MTANTATATASVTSASQASHGQGLDDASAGSTTEDPPDTQSKDFYGATSPPLAIIDERRMGLEAAARSSPLTSYSPGTHDGGRAGSVSDYDHEHELDSPSSLSSWNSWAGGRRGDLADVEDFELEGAHEPELETVSELDEESSGFYSGSERLNSLLDSEDEAAGSGSSPGSKQGGWSSAQSNEHSPRRKQYRLSDHMSSLGIAKQNKAPGANQQSAGSNNGGGIQHTAHYAYHLHPHGTPSYPHFSPRAGGHGLSHHSRYYQRAPPNVAARRRKGRLAELAEEPPSAGDGIKSTVMPTTPRAGPVPDGDVPPVPSVDTVLHRSNKDFVDDQGNARNTISSNLSETSSSFAQEDTGPLTPTPGSRSDFEIFGPPAPPVRCVSPSETVPVVPSPLCEWITAPEEDTTATTEAEAPANEASNACETPREERSLTPTPVDDEIRAPEKAAEDADVTIEAPASGFGSPPSPTTSGMSLEHIANRSTPPSTPPTSPPVSRSNFGRRLSSPTQSRAKKPLRPCFKRGSSTQSSHVQSSRDSSVERGDGRGRTKVRFSPAPPVEVRTHSPVDYDRKACPINNRLSFEDLEELRTMKMEMGLLEAKCAALSAIKHDALSAMKHDESATQTESESETEQCVARWTAQAAKQGQHATAADRKRADSISSSSPSTFCASRFADRAHGMPSAADYLRLEREKERERVCRMAGIGVGAGFRYSGGGKPNTRQMPHGGCEALGASIVNRWGLSKPPPPLPGMPASCPASPPSNVLLKSNESSNQGDQEYLYGSHCSPTFAASTQMRPASTPPGHGRRMPSESDAAKELDALSTAKDTNKDESAIAEESDQLLDEPRGRSAVKDFNGRRKGHNDSASTDATITPSSSVVLGSNGQGGKSDVPALIRTAPSPKTSPDGHHSRSRSPIEERLRNMYATTLQQQQLQAQNKHTARPDASVRPQAHKPPAKHIDAIAPMPPVSSLPSQPSFGSGYDSPASEFYESGSEYDLLC